ncbi:carboxylesterase 4A-like isoform X2 [Ciona intestinalis]
MSYYSVDKLRAWRKQSNLTVAFRINDEKMRWFCIALLFIFQYKLVECQLLVNTTLGLAQGQLSSYGRPVTEFLGIPYAEPPIGPNRFEPPAPSLPWNFTKYFYQYGSSCYQASPTTQQRIKDKKTTDEVLVYSDMSEDCLFLNIYTPWRAGDIDNLLPVMIFVHGGNFQRGTGKVYKGAKLAGDNNVVVVTFNYRLGVLGFLCGKENGINGNYGLLDQVEAFRWVKNNIEAFGGDPAKITIFGEEAGGSSVHMHALYPKSEGLFSNVIIQSAAYDDSLWSRQQANDAFELFLKSAGVSADENLSVNLQNISVQNLINSSQVVSDWHPCISSSFINEFPSEIMAVGNFSSSKKNVNIMCGSNSGAGQENNVNVNEDDWLMVLTESVVQEAFPQQYGLITNDDITRMSSNYFKYYAAYQDDNNSTMKKFQIKNIVENVVGDQTYFTWAQEISGGMESEVSSIFQYRFSLVDSSGIVSSSGAPISEELVYLFGYNVSPEYDTMSKDIMKYWTNFAKSGNPNWPDNTSATWPEYKASEQQQCRSRLTLDSLPYLSTHYISHDEVTSRSWEFWGDYYKTLGFACNDTLPANTSTTDPSEPTGPCVCEASVAEIFGIALSNEAAAILMFVFISISGVFILSLLVACCCLCKFKRALKKEMKKHKRPSIDRSYDNPTCSAYKL